MPNLSLANISKTFVKTSVLNNISIEVQDAELFFLLGPSGCGKTTLLRIIAGFEIPDLNTANPTLLSLGNEDLLSKPPYDRQIGMVFQNYALWPHMTVQENISFGLEMRGLPKKEIGQRALEALEMVRMPQLALRFPRELSGGQQQRVALARALVLEPKLLLLDEPLSNLDSKLRLELRDEILNLHERLKVTMIYVTHDQSEALSMADRIALLSKGSVVQVGSPAELCKNPAGEFVREFLAEINLVEAAIMSCSPGKASVALSSNLMTVRCHDRAKDGKAVTVSIQGTIVG